MGAQAVYDDEATGEGYMGSVFVSIADLNAAPRRELVCPLIHERTGEAFVQNENYDSPAVMVVSNKAPRDVEHRVSPARSRSQHRGSSSRHSSVNSSPVKGGDTRPLTPHSQSKKASRAASSVGGASSHSSSQATSLRHSLVTAVSLLGYSRARANDALEAATAR